VTPPPGWLPAPAWLWALFPLLASLFLFVSDSAKEDDAGFFGGFLSRFPHLFGEQFLHRLIGREFVGTLFASGH
jgi:hypothetical protein